MDSFGGTDEVPWQPLLRALTGEPAPSELAEIWTDACVAARAVANAVQMPRIVAPSVSLSAGTGFEDPSFQIDATWVFPFQEQLVQSRRVGAWYPSFRRGDVLLPDRAWALMEAMDQPLPSHRSGRMLWWARVRRLADAMGADIDPYLANEDAVLVERIAPTFADRPDGGVDVRPTAPDVSPDDFAQALGVQPIGDVMNLRQGGERRRRIVLEPAAQEGLAQVQAKPTFTAEEAVTLAASPERFFDPTLFDLSQYSERVIGFGPPRYRANVVVKNPQGNTWFGDREGDEPAEVWLDLHDERRPDAEPVRIDLADDERRGEVKAIVDQAWQRGDAYADIDRRWVRVTPELQAVLSDLPGKHRQELPPPNPRPSELEGMVLQIEDNVDELGFGERGALPLVPITFQPAWPAGMDPSLPPKAHQQSGFRTLAWWSERTSTPIVGGLIADDMGLGKTFQVLALMARLAEQGRLRPSLVIAPASLLVNWAQEARRFAPNAIHTILQLKDVPRSREAVLQQADLVLTSYESLAQRDIEVGRIPWKLVVCDEAQKIKNPSTRIAHAAKGMQADVRVAITGTPVENSLDDLWSITDFFQPGLLGSLSEFRKQHGGAVIADEGRRAEASTALRSTLAPVMIRRMKRDAGLDLPPIEIQRVDCPMSDTQQALYARVRELRGNHQGAALAAINRMLQVCAWPGLLSPVLSSPAEAVRTCPKAAKTLDLLDEIRKRGEKVLVFARWIELQIALAELVRWRFGVQANVLNGTVPADRRQGVIDAFGSQPGFGVLVLAPRACGIGLNITAANHVIHYTREWNPAVEAQATDRVYRIGQRRPVQVYLPVVTHPDNDSAEVILARVLQSKESLREDFIHPVDHAKAGVEDFVKANAFVYQASPLSVSDLRFADPERIAALLSGRNTQVQRELRPPEGRLFELSDGVVRWIVDADAVPSAWPEDVKTAKSRELVFIRPIGVLHRTWLAARGWTLVTPEAAVERLAGNGVTVDQLLRKVGDDGG